MTFSKLNVNEGFNSSTFSSLKRKRAKKPKSKFASVRVRRNAEIDTQM